MALPFAASADFAYDKAAGDPCRHLAPGFGCEIHSDLRDRGFPGCVAYDCFGAGQHVSTVTFGGRSWRDAPRTASSMFAVFTVMRQLHELACYLSQALTMVPARSVYAELTAARGEVERHTEGSPESLVALDVAALRQKVAPLLSRASALTRAEARHGLPWPRHVRGAPVRAHADLTGADLRGADLVGADLRGACLIGADLRGADARAADVLGADTRGADLRAANLTGALFLTQSQLGSARGDAATALSAGLDRPTHWSGQSR